MIISQSLLFFVFVFCIEQDEVAVAQSELHTSLRLYEVCQVQKKQSNSVRQKVGSKTEHTYCSSEKWMERFRQCGHTQKGKEVENE